MASDNKGTPSKGAVNKKPVQRSSKKPKKPVTIDLEAAKVVSNPVKKPAADSSQKAAANPAPNLGAQQDTKQSTKKSSASAVPSVKSTATNPKTASIASGEIKSETGKASDKPASSNTSKTSSSIEKPAEKPLAKDSGKKPVPEDSQNKRASASDKGGSAIGLVFAGILGGIIALAGAYVLQQVGIISSGNADNSELSAKVAQIDQNLKSFGEKFDASTEPDANSLQDTKQFVARITELEAQQKSAAAKISAQSKAIETVVVKSDSLQQTISSGAAGENAALVTLDERVKSLESSANNATEPVSSELKAQLETVKKKIDEVSGEIAEVSKSAADTQASSVEKISAVENTLISMQDKLAGLGPRLEKVEAVAATPQKDEQRVARALAVAGLKSAIDDGGNFESALALVESLNADSKATDPLKPFAAIGVPTLSALENAFSGLSDEIVKTATPAENTGAVDKFLSNIRSLVTIKTTGVVEGSNPQAIVSRIKHGLKIADLEAVIKEWGSLPDAAKTVSNDWNEKVKARHSANSLIENLLKQFMTGASGAGN